MTYAAPVLACAILPAENWIRSNSCSGMCRSKLQNDTLAASRSCRTPSMIDLALNQMRTADRERAGADNSLLGDKRGVVAVSRLNSQFSIEFRRPIHHAVFDDEHRFPD